MSVRKRVLAIVVIGALLLAMGIGPGVGHRAQALPQSSAEPAPATLPYAGRLSDGVGKPVADAAYDFSFTLYGAVSGCEPLWSEVQRGVPVSKGEFLTSLGSIEPLPATALGGENRWLAVSVRGPGEAEFTPLAPRQRLDALSVATPASPSAGAACPHDHLGELWIGDSGAPIDGLFVQNTRPAVPASPERATLVTASSVSPAAWTRVACTATTQAAVTA
jgi:hypothetical protein